MFVWENLDQQAGLSFAITILTITIFAEYEKLKTNYDNLTLAQFSYHCLKVAKKYIYIYICKLDLYKIAGKPVDISICVHIF